MCDTILAPPDSAAGNVMLFGKNSDRQRNEAQTVEYFPAAGHGPDAALTCTYITIPQARHTHAALICRPFWMWGAEMGANEHGVAIGNEALHARTAAPETKALTGADLVRLGLERATTAADALDVITSLLERHGQGGNCGHLTPVYYNNGFVIADASEAFVLETIGREWLVERVRDVRALSNRYSIDHATLRISSGLSAFVRDSGLTADAGAGYAQLLANPNREHLGNAGARRARSTSLLSSRAGRLSAADMMSILRDHGSGAGGCAMWRAECAVERTLCMHAGAEDRPGQTVGSMVSELTSKDSVHWVTGSAAPCIAIFKPVLMDVPLPAHGPLPTDRFDARSLWWQHERLHRAALFGDFAQFLTEIGPEREALEADFNTRVKAVLNGGNIAERAQVITECWRQAIGMQSRWQTRIKAPTSSPGDFYTSGWEPMNQLAGIDSI